MVTDRPRSAAWLGSFCRARRDEHSRSVKGSATAMQSWAAAHSGPSYGAWQTTRADGRCRRFGARLWRATLYCTQVLLCSVDAADGGRQVARTKAASQRRFMHGSAGAGADSFRCRRLSNHQTGCPDVCSVILSVVVLQRSQAWGGHGAALPATSPPSGFPTRGTAPAPVTGWPTSASPLRLFLCPLPGSRCRPFDMCTCAARRLTWPRHGSSATCS
jgi:hypothetical protein